MSRKFAICIKESTNNQTSRNCATFYRYFSCKKAVCRVASPLPFSKTLFLQVMRANFNNFVQKKCLKTDSDLPSLDKYGWIFGTECEGKGHPELQQNVSAPAPAFQLVSCSCSRICVTVSFGCIFNNLKGASIYRIQNCSITMEVI